MEYASKSPFWLDLDFGGGFYILGEICAALDKSASKYSQSTTNKMQLFSIYLFL